MHFTIVTAFPEFFNDFLSTSIIGRAVKAGLIRVDVQDLRSFGQGGYRRIDDYAFGAGGMVLMAEPLSDALEAVRSVSGESAFVVYPTPQGVLLTQETVETLSRQEHVVIVCGHYEGLDERFVEREVDLEVTIGDCVLTGGEIPAMAIIDAVSRLTPGVVGNGGAVEEDSFYRGMLDHPHYTRPASWNGQDVPEVLLSGNASDIEEWRRGQAVSRTISRRPELLTKCSLLGYMRGGFYLSLNLADDWTIGRLRDLAGLCESYGVARAFLVVRDPRLRDSVRDALGEEDFRGRDKLKLMPSPDRMTDWIEQKEGLPLQIDVCDTVRSGAWHWLEVKRLILEKGKPVLFRLSWNGAEEGDSGSLDIVMAPAQEGKLPFCGKVTALLDRFLGTR